MQRTYYCNSINLFNSSPLLEILGILAKSNEFDLQVSQRETWEKQIIFLKSILEDYEGTILFEFSIPRMGRRIDVVLIIKHVVFVLEFKIGEKKYLNNALYQVRDYAVDK